MADVPAFPSSLSFALVNDDADRFENNSLNDGFFDLSRLRSCFSCCPVLLNDPDADPALCGELAGDDAFDKFGKSGAIDGEKFGSDSTGIDRRLLLFLLVALVLAVGAEPVGEGGGGKWW